MQTAVPLACFLSMIRPPGVQYENALLQIAPVDKSKCPYIKDNNDVGFQLFTRHNPTAYQELVLGDDEKLFASNMDYTDKTVIYFHAWMEQPDDGSGIMVREAYMQRGDTNVIMVDAHHLEAGPWYFTAAQNTWYIGRFAALFIDYLASRGLNLNNTHLIGHSLGAHAAGVAGSALKSGRVARITGLDPALPLFDNLPLEQRLDTTDAHFVDIVHTDAGIFGYKAPMGHADFYPNGGVSPQPGCELEVVLPKQLLLNKCEGRMQTRGFYSYYLTANQDRHLKHKSLESKLENLFAYIQSVKTSNRTKEEKVIKDRKQLESDEKVRQDENDTETVIRDIDRTIGVKTKDQQTKKVSNETLNDSIKDVLSRRDEISTEDYVEDQIAEASEYDVTQIEFDQDELKNKETVSLINESEELVLEGGKAVREGDRRGTFPDANKTDGDDIKRNDIVIKTNVNNTRPLQDELTEKFNDTSNEEGFKISTETTRFNLYDLDDVKKYNTAENATYKHADKRENSVTILNYKDPCDTKKSTDYTNVQVAEVEPVEIDKKMKPKSKVNILNVLGTTYRISRIISTLKQNKEPFTDKLKNLLLFKDSKTTTATNTVQNYQERTKNHVVKRQKRFLPFFKRTEEAESGNILFKMLDFLIKNRKNVLPVFTVMREINTLVKSGNGELNHFTREQNNYIGATPPVFTPVSYNLELGGENKAVAFVKRLLGMSPKGDRLTINGRK